jgi:hypothetical protein
MLQTAKRVKTGVNGGTPTLLFRLALSCVFVGLAIVSWAAIDERPSPSEIAARFTCQILDKTP